MFLLDYYVGKGKRNEILVQSFVPIGDYEKGVMFGIESQKLLDFARPNNDYMFPQIMDLFGKRYKV